MNRKQQPENTAASTHTEVNILLVDDRTERLLSYEVALENMGYNLVRAQSGAEALGWLMKMEFATILLDVSMPEMDGFETAAMIRDHPRFEETPIIFVTGVQITELDQRKGYEIGAVDYIQIPFVSSILRGKVQALVQLYLQRAELSRLNKELASANAQLAKAHEELKAEKMRELELLNQYLEHANAELKTTNDKFIQEIGEREKAEQALHQASERKDQYIAILAHELRNPLSAIHNAIQVMNLETATEDQLEWAKSLLERQVKHLTCLMDDLLDVSRISSGRIQLRLEPLDVRTVVNHASDTLAPMFAKMGHTLKITMPEEPCCVNGDLVRLTQILDNLLTNAAKYTNPGGSIELFVQAYPDKKRLLMKVRDEGVGIPSELLSEVFELFVQAPTATNRAQGGLGIGLALVRALVEQHGGETFVNSDGPGKGAEFSVALPLIDVSAMTQAKSEKAIAQRPGQSLRLLIVDDNVDSANGLAMCMETQGFITRMAHSGEQGVLTAADFAPDVVLLDIGLPDIDGYEVATRLRADRSLKSTKLVAMTGFSGLADKQKAQICGFDHYLVKPVDLPRLMDLLGSFAEV